MTTNTDEMTSRAHRSDEYSRTSPTSNVDPRTGRPPVRTDGGDARYAVGLMSGTSLDGIDAACCSVTEMGTNEEYPYEIAVESFVSEEYPNEIRARLVKLCDEKTGTVDEACRLNVGLGTLLADVATQAMDEAGVDPDEVAVIGSHGQTIWHIGSPESIPGIVRPQRSTLQIADGSVIARETGVTTVSDFRTADVAAGGHGAPLAPYLDATAFSDGEHHRSLQNIGGIGNCTLLPPSPGRDDVRAFDTGPGNMVIDAVVEILTNGERTYDVDGEIATQGTPDESMIDQLIDDPYLAESPPKTTGREDFGHEYARQFIDAGRDRGLEDADLVATATAFTAATIADAYERFAEPYPEEVFVSGGGAYNPTLMTMLSERVACDVHRLSALGFDPDAKEAALFALMGVARLDGRPNNIPGATGADEPVVMGKVSLP